jgi:hypothetical protein
MRININDKIAEKLTAIAAYSNVRLIDFVNNALLAVVEDAQEIIREDIDAHKNKEKK